MFFVSMIIRQLSTEIKPSSLFIDETKKCTANCERNEEFHLQLFDLFGYRPGCNRGRIVI